jgi:hypothetical protein
MQEETVEQLMDVAMWLRWACRRNISFKTEALSTISQRALAAVMPPLHDMSHQAIVLKSGIRLGLLGTT